MSETTEFIFGKPRDVKDLGNVYPIKLKNYDEFVEYATMLQVSKQTMKVEEDEVTNFDLLIGLIAQDESFLYSVLGLLNLVTDRHFHFDTQDGEIKFVDSNGDSELKKSNYDEFRNAVMTQNLIFEKKVYKNQHLQEWVDMVLAERSKKSIKVTLESMITTVHVLGNVDFHSIEDYTIYQLKALFEQVNKVKDYEASVQIVCAGSEKAEIKPYMSELNMFKNPYDDVFKDSGKLSNLNNAINS